MLCGLRVFSLSVCFLNQNQDLAGPWLTVWPTRLYMRWDGGRYLVEGRLPPNHVLQIGGHSKAFGHVAFREVEFANWLFWRLSSYFSCRSPKRSTSFANPCLQGLEACGKVLKLSAWVCILRWPSRQQTGLSLNQSAVGRGWVQIPHLFCSVYTRLFRGNSRMRLLISRVGKLHFKLRERP